MRFNPVTSTNPRLIEAYLRKKVLEFFTNEVEESTTITSSHGYYTLSVKSKEFDFSVGRFRKKHIPEIVKSLRFLANK